MREYLEDAHEHRDDGYGRAQAHVRQQLPKRFYKDVGITPLGDGYAVALDGRSPRTPGMKPVVVPNEAIAQVMVEEWSAQGEFINLETMPLVRLVNSAVESGDERVPALRAEIVKYASNDLLLYRAESPESLVRRQEELWDPVLIELARRFSLSFQPTIGIVHQPQPPTTIDRVARALDGQGLFPLIALNSVTAITGSGLLTLALLHGITDPVAVWTAAHVDEDHNIGFWGEVEEITTRREKRRREYDAAVRLLDMAATLNPQ